MMPPTGSEYDVVVVGAGAAGLAAGRRLAESGLVVVLEACSAADFSTAPGAHRTGLAAADAAMAALRHAPAGAVAVAAPG
jgi:cation diffusion facilitator CzcD-associated flavoprotein CzcO